MANVQELTIKLLGEDKASKEIKNVGDSLAGLGKAAIGVATGGLALITGAIAGLSAISIDFIKEAMAAQEVEAQLDAVYKTTTQAIDEQNAAWAKAAGQFVTTTDLASDANKEIAKSNEAMKKSWAELPGKLEEAKAKLTDMLVVQAKGKPTTATFNLELQRQQEAVDNMIAALAAGPPVMQEWESETVAMTEAMNLAPPVILPTKEAMVELANSLMNVTRFEDETILSAETMLLQFKNIGGDIFPMATRATLDLATRLGMDAPAAAKLLGKALVEPGEGLLRLKMAGVAFTDEQTKMIQAMAESGDMAGAQKMILDELNKSIGGAAEAAGTTLAGQLDIMKNKFGNIKEQIGTAFIPALSQLMEKFKEWLDSPEIKAGIDKLSKWIAEEAPKIIMILVRYIEEYVIPAVKEIWRWLQEEGIPWLQENIPKIIDWLVKAFDTVQKAVKDVKIAWNTVKGTYDDIRGAFDDIRGAIEGLIQRVAELALALLNLTVPDWLIPGSPTPLELGIRGITEAMQDLTALAPNLTVALAGGGNTATSTTNNNYNLAIYSQARTESVAADFLTMQALARA